MATALKQLKEMEERVKGVPALENEVAKLRAEKDMLLLALEEKKVAVEVSQQKHQSTESSTQTTETLQTDHSRLTSPTGHKGLVKPGELKRLTEKFEGKEQKSPQTASKVFISAPEKAVLKKSVAVGEDVPMASVVFYHSHGVKDESVCTEVRTSEKCTETEAPAAHEKGLQARAETEEAEVWVIESLLGLSTEAQREMDTLQDTIKFQQESIAALEDRLIEADKDLGVLRAQMDEKTSKITFDKGTLTKPDVKNAQVETITSALKHAATMCRPEMMDVCVGGAAGQNEQGTQTDAAAETEPAPVERVSVGCQWEKLTDEKSEEQKVTVPKKRQITIAEYKVSPEEEVIGAEGKQHRDQEEETTASKTGQFCAIFYRSFRTKQKVQEKGSNSTRQVQYKTF